MKSVRQIYSEMTGIRMNATSYSLWQAADTLREYVRLALNDGLAMYPVRVGQAWYTATVNTVGGRVGLPNYMGKITNIRSVHSSYYDADMLPHFTVTPTVNTTFVKINTDYAGTILVEYEAELSYAPTDTTLKAMSFVTNQLDLESNAVLSRWPQQGYVEVTSWTPSTEFFGKHEYNGITGYVAADPIMDIVHWGVDGADKNWAVASGIWPLGSAVSYTYPDNRQVRPAVLQAQASLYGYLIHDRATYNQFTALVSSQAMPMKDMLMLISSYEARARIAFTRVRPVREPQPTRLRRPWPR